MAASAANAARHNGNAETGKTGTAKRTHEEMGADREAAEEGDGAGRARAAEAEESGDTGREGLATGTEAHAELAARTPAQTDCAEMSLTGAGARAELTHAEPTAETPARADTAPQPPKRKKRMRKSKDVKKWTKK